MTRVEVAQKPDINPEFLGRIGAGVAVETGAQPAPEGVAVPVQPATPQPAEPSSTEPVQPAKPGPQVIPPVSPSNPPAAPQQPPAVNVTVNTPAPAKPAA